MEWINKWMNGWWEKRKGRKGEKANTKHWRRKKEVRKDYESEGEVLSAATGTFLTSQGYTKCCPGATKERKKRWEWRKNMRRIMEARMGGNCLFTRLSSFGTKCHCHKSMACTVQSRTIIRIQVYRSSVWLSNQDDGMAVRRNKAYLTHDNIILMVHHQVHNYYLSRQTLDENILKTALQIVVQRRNVSIPVTGLCLLLLIRPRYAKKHIPLK